MGSSPSGVPAIGDIPSLSRPSWRGSSLLSPGKTLMRSVLRNKVGDRDPIGKSSNFLFQKQDPGTIMCRGISAAIHSQGSELSVPGLVAWAWRKSVAWGLSSLLKQAHIVPTAERYTVWALHNLVEFHSQGGLRSSGRQLILNGEEAKKE